MAQQPITLRIRQRRRRRLILLAGVLALIVVGGLAYLLLAPDGEQRETAEPQPGMVRVPVVAMRVPAGEQIPSRLLRHRYLPPERVPADALLHDGQILGRVALRDVPPGAYLREDDLAPIGAPSGLSGLARPGRRVVVVPAGQMHAVPEFLSPGDRVDVLAISLVGPALPGFTNLDRLRRSPTTVEGGGSQPGDPNALSRRLARAGVGLAPELPVTATLVGEDAEILVAPDSPRAGARPRPGSNYVALQMSPEEAHVTTLALAAGQQLRFVYRPFNDRQRITAVKAVEEFTHPPRDIRRVEVFNGVSRRSDYTILD